MTLFRFAFKIFRNYPPKGAFFFILSKAKCTILPFIEDIRGEKYYMNKKNTPRDEPIDWHAGFRDSIQLALHPYRDSLRFEFEHPLNHQPLRIDAVILKEDKEAVIDNPIGAIFRDVNVLEYKSPEDHLSTGDFYKTQAYALLYCTQNGVKATDMSVSLVADSHPRKLFEYLKQEHGIEMWEQRPGIYYLEGVFFPTQVIETKRLEETGGGLWLKNLRRGLNGKRLREIMDLSRQMPEGTPLSAFLYTLIQANRSGAREMMAMSEAVVKEVLMEFAEKYGYTAEWEAKGMARGQEDAVRRLQRYGMGAEQIAEALELPLDTVFRYLQTQ
jgi:hypothetical protein